MATPVKITELTSLTSATGDDLFVVVDGLSANTPVTKKITVAGVFGNIQANSVFKNPVTFSNTVSFSASPSFSGDVTFANNITTNSNDLYISIDDVIYKLSPNLGNFANLGDYIILNVVNITNVKD